MTVLKKIAIWPFTKMMALLSALLGLLFGIIMAVLLSSGFESTSYPDLTPGMAIIAYPIAYGIVALVLSALTAWLYNILAASTGGLELEFEEKKIEKTEKKVEKKLEAKPAEKKSEAKKKR